MGRRSTQCRLCSAGQAAVALLALAIPTAVVRAAKLPAGEAQLPFLLSQGQQSQPQQHTWQQTEASNQAWTSQEDGRTQQRDQDEAVVRVSLVGLQDEQVEQVFSDLEAAELDIWQRKRGQHVDIRVSPDFFESTLYETLKHRASITIPSVEQIIETQAQLQRASWSSVSTQIHASLMEDPSAGLHSLYHSHASIDSLLELFASDYPGFAKLEKIGESAEGRTISVLKVSDYRKKKETSGQIWKTWRTYSRKALRTIMPDISIVKTKPKHKLGFALLGGQHAREWISPASLIYIAHSLITSASSASTSSMNSWSDECHDIMTFLSDYELHFIPMANPDGYVYAWEHDRLWVRSRQNIGSNETRCHGIDLNRNWGYKWEKPFRPNPCSDSYPGSKPFEAIENQVIKQYLEKVKKSSRLDVFLDVHSFGQLIMYPYSYSCSAIPPDAENLFEALLRASKAIHGVHKQNYDVGGVCDVSYTATGQSLDWTYHDLGAKWSFAANLRDQGIHAFLLPPDQIIPTGQEMLAGLLDLAQFIAQKERIEA